MQSEIQTHSYYNVYYNNFSNDPQHLAGVCYKLDDAHVRARECTSLSSSAKHEEVKGYQPECGKTRTCEWVIYSITLFSVQVVKTAVA